MADALLLAGFCAAAAVSLATSWVLVSRLELIGAHLGLSEGLLGMLAALAADAPEITAAVTALAGHHTRIGAGVVIGSNVFNLAALLGFAPVLAGAVMLHRRVVVLEGIVATWVAGCCLAAVLGALAPAGALAAAVAVLGPYVVVLGVRHGRLQRLGVPQRWSRWLEAAVVEEELELAGALDIRESALATRQALAATLIVVGASVAMEQCAARLGSNEHISTIVIGALVLAAVTSLPNAVAAVYLARRGRGAATLSTAMNSNALNVTLGLLLPASVAGGLGGASAETTLVAAWYLGLTVFVLGAAYLARGLRRAHGVAIIALYAAFVAALLSTG